MKLFVESNLPKKHDIKKIKTLKTERNNYLLEREKHSVHFFIEGIYLEATDDKIISNHL